MYKIETSMYPLIILANSATSVDQFHSGNTAEGLLCAAFALITTGVSIVRGNQMVDETRVDAPVPDAAEEPLPQGI